MSTDPHIPSQDEADGNERDEQERQEETEAEDEPAETLTFDDADREFRRKSNDIGRRFREALDRLA